MRNAMAPTPGTPSAGTRRLRPRDSPTSSRGCPAPELQGVSGDSGSATSGERPDQYRASITFRPPRPPVGRRGPRLDRGSRVRVRGLPDVYARRGSVAVETDRVSAELFDEAEFDAICERIEDGYSGSHPDRPSEKWRRHDDGPVRAHVIVPVKPLFPPDEADDPTARAATENRSRLIGESRPKSKPTDR